MGKPGLLRLLQITYPHYPWKPEMFTPFPQIDIEDSPSSSKKFLHTSSNSSNSSNTSGGSLQLNQVSKAQWMLYKMVEYLFCNPKSSSDGMTTQFKTLKKEDIFLGYQYMMEGSKVPLCLLYYSILNYLNIYSILRISTLLSFFLSLENGIRYLYSFSLPCF